MPDPIPLIQKFGHIATRQQLIAAGCSGFDLTIAVRRGQIGRIRQARYTTPGATFEALAAARVGGMLAGVSAVGSYGLWSGFDRRIHISVGDNSSRLRTNFEPRLKPVALTPDLFNREVVLHWLVGGAVPELGPECWRVPWPSALRQVAAWSDRETAVACLDTALTLFRITKVELAAIFEGAPKRELLVAQASCEGSDSGPESIVRQRLLAVGIQVIQQVQFAAGRVDMQVAGTRVLIEVDGKSFHDSAEARRRDEFRDAALLELNYVVVRLSFSRIFEDWDWCLSTIRQAIATAPR